MQEMYRQIVRRRITETVAIWRMSHPDSDPHAIVVGELVRSQMAMAKVLRLVGGRESWYENHRILFCESPDLCIGVGSTPG
jgi:hypothetical protein